MMQSFKIYCFFLNSYKFRCQLKQRMLYWGYLLPMVLIILHNIVIFCLVLRVIFKQGNMAASEYLRLYGLIGNILVYKNKMIKPSILHVNLNFPHSFKFILRIKLRQKIRRKLVQMITTITPKLYVTINGVYCKVPRLWRLSIVI